MRKRIKLVSVASLLLLLGTVSVPFTKTEANSAQTRWNGVSSTGAIVAEGTCPIEVTNEKLTFDLQEFPQNYFTKEEYLAYEAKVTATYSFYNPTDYTVRATLVFPFGKFPDYAPIQQDDDGFSPVFDTDKYDITVNGEAVEKTLRHSLSGVYEKFELEKDLSRLSDEYVSDNFYYPELTVTKYTYTAYNLTKSRAYACFSYEPQTTGGRIWVKNSDGVEFSDEQIKLGCWVQNGEDIVIYEIGSMHSPLWTLFENGKMETKADGELLLMKAEEMTFEEFAFSEYFGEYTQEKYNPERWITRYDWYNAVVHSMNENLLEKYGVIRYYRAENQSQFLRWYQYQIEIPPKTTVINEVTAPMYPSINAGYSSPVYKYIYLLSPAKTWKEFGSLEIEITTPYYLVNDKNGFSKTDTGYVLSRNGLPDGELEFSLSAEENPTNKNKSGCAYSGLFAFSAMRSCVSTASPLPYGIGVLLTAVGAWSLKRRK